jgi:hypothetical protein
VDYTLITCGGQPHGQSIQNYGKQCFSLDTNTTEPSPAWIAMEDMPAARAYFEFVTYGDAAYAIAGYTGAGEFNRVDRWSKTTGWVQMTNYPHNNHRFCAVADEGYDRIYSLGGVTTAYRQNAYYYTPSKNQWTSMPTLKYKSYDSGCAIITQKGAGNRWIVLAGTHSKDMQYYDLTSPSKWIAMTSAVSAINRISLISLTSYEAYQVGGYTATFSYHTRNWWIWDPQSTRFENHNLNMRREHVGGDFTRIPEDAMLLRTCSLL